MTFGIVHLNIVKSKKVRAKNGRVEVTDRHNLPNPSLNECRPRAYERSPYLDKGPGSPYQTISGAVKQNLIKI